MFHTLSRSSHEHHQRQRAESVRTDRPPAAGLGGGEASGRLTIEDVITEVAASRITERGATRADDKFSEAAMEDRKREGYF